MLTHLIAADVRHHRLLLAAWLVIVAATATVDGARPILSDGALVRTVGILGSLLSLTQALLMLVLIPSVVQTHPLVGSNAFWMTRPIPPDMLLVSKIVLLGAATVALPTVVGSVLMAAYSVPVAQIVPVAAQTALHQTFWMILLMAAAALTPNLMRFALVCGGALAALALFLAVTVAMFMTRMNDLPLAAGGGGGGGTDEPTAGFVLNVLSLYLRNRHKSEAVAGFASDFDQGAFLSGFLPFYAGRQTSGFRARSVLIRFPPGYGDDQESLSIDDEWLEGAELVVVRTIRQGSVERRLDIVDFRLRAASKSIPASER